MMVFLLKVASRVMKACLVFFVVLVGLLVVVYYQVEAGLPDAEEIRNIKLQAPLNVYTKNGELMAVFGDKKRIPIPFRDVPSTMVKAFLAAEDANFFYHQGVDYAGLARAALTLLRTGKKTQGGSTITMQVARNFFLTRDRTFTRKIKEIFLAFMLEWNHSKEQIINLYLNKIFLGKRAYGVAAAADIYYGKTVDELTLSQTAMLAGLPKAPSRYNPLVNAYKAKLRRDYILNRMLALKFIDNVQFQDAIEEPLSAKLHSIWVDLEAPYAAEEARRWAVERYGKEAYENNLHIITTIHSKLQSAAQHALRNGLMHYDRRHGWRQEIAHFDDSDGEVLLAKLSTVPVVAELEPVVVTQVTKKHAFALTQQNTIVQVEGWDWAGRYINENARGLFPKDAHAVFEVGDVVYVRGEDGRHLLAQVPRASAAITAIEADGGAILAIVGGFSFQQSKFNRALQAKRQSGSSFKPFIFAAALANGYTPATVINDSPVIFNLRGRVDDWRPVNYSGKFHGPTRMRDALVYSRNLVAIKILEDLQLRPTKDYLANVGFSQDQLPDNLTLALGTGLVTPLELTQSYASFANGGKKVGSYLVERVFEDSLFEGRLEIYNHRSGDLSSAVPDYNTKTTILGEDELLLLGEDSPNISLSTALSVVPTTASETSCKEDCEIIAPPPFLPHTHTSKDTLNEGVATASGISPAIAFQVTSMMQDVIKKGTGRLASKLGRSDIAGKTGTTNDFRDAWFIGFSRNIVCGVWVGFDDYSSLGKKEEGARVALPIWIDFMQTALANVEEIPFYRPDNIVVARIHEETGLLAGSSVDVEKTIVETFRHSYVPKFGNPPSANSDQEEELDALF